MISRRALEILTAALTLAFGAAILVSSILIGVGWTPRGLGSGAFPAIAGTLIVAGSLYNLVRTLPRPGEAILDWPRVRRIGAMFVPAAAFVAAIPLLGLHVAAGAYALAMIASHRNWPRWRAVAIGIATPLALYAIFDWGFQVALPRGMLGAALGF